MSKASQQPQPYKVPSKKSRPRSISPQPSQSQGAEQSPPGSSAASSPVSPCIARKSESESDSPCEADKRDPTPQSGVSFVLNKQLVDIRYPNPEKHGDFKVFFGKYKTMMFKDVLQDVGYSQFILGIEAKSKNSYLLQRYLIAKGITPKSPKAE